MYLEGKRVHLLNWDLKSAAVISKLDVFWEPDIIESDYELLYAVGAGGYAQRYDECCAINRKDIISIGYIVYAVADDGVNGSDWFDVA